jgi:hypothetical protein
LSVPEAPFLRTTTGGEHDFVRSVPQARPDPTPGRLCVGMATYDDFDGVWFTIQAIRMYQSEVLADLSFVVIDNHPEGVAAHALKALADWLPHYRYVPFGGYQGTSVKDLVFREADADIVCCVDCHVLLRPGALAQLRTWFDGHPDSRDLLQGPLLYDGLQKPDATHLEPTWGGGMFGQWARDPRIDDPDCAPFEISMQGLGVFACRKDAWPGLNPRLRGFSSDEGYLHEKFRQRGGRVLCHPGLAWAHRFPRPAGTSYPNNWEDRVRNYYLAWSEIGWDFAPGEQHFRELLGSQLDVSALLEHARKQAEHPLNVFDAVFCVAPDVGTCDPDTYGLGISWRVEHLVPDPTLEPRHRRLAVWREAVREAARRRYEHVLVLEDASGPAETAPRVDLSKEWDLCLLPLMSSGGVKGASVLDGLAVAAHARAYDQLLSDIPADDAGRTEFLATWGDLDSYLLKRVAQGVFTAVGAPFAPIACDRAPPASGIEVVDRPAPAPGIEVVELAEGLMVRQVVPSRVHHLNNTASIVLQLCDGERSAAEIAEVVAESFGLANSPVAEVSACIEGLRRAGVLVGRDASHEERGVTVQSALAAPSDGNAGSAGGGAAGEARVPTGRPPAVDAENRAAVGADPGSERRSPAMNGGYPAVSCICPTYGRPELLEEAIQSFLLQDYRGPKELIVLNDFDRQFLMFDHPEVTIINLPRRFRTLGEKHNAAVALASHDLIFVWDDDDIYLPHRLTFSVERFDVRKGFFKPGRAWLWNDGQLSGPEANLLAAGSCWSRELFERVRNYAPMGLGHDVEMEARFEEVAPGSTRSYDISSEDIYYVYRWGGTGTYHGSGFGQDQHRAVGEYVHEQVRLGLLQTGQIALAPRWKVDYVELVREHLIGPR